MSSHSRTPSYRRMQPWHRHCYLFASCSTSCLLSASRWEHQTYLDSWTIVNLSDATSHLSTNGRTLNMKPTWRRNLHKPMRPYALLSVQFFPSLLLWGALPDVDGLNDHSDQLYPFVVGSPGCNPPMSSIRDVLLLLNNQYSILSEESGEHSRMVASNASDTYRIAQLSFDDSMAWCSPYWSFMLS